MITLHIEAETWDEVRSKALSALGVPTTVRISEVVEAKAAPKIEGTKYVAPAGSGTGGPGGGKTEPKTEPKVDAPVVEEKVAEETFTHSGETGEDGLQPKTYDYETDVKPIVLRVSGKLQRAGVMSLLEPFGVENASKVPAERYGELIAAAKKMLEEG